MAKGSNGGKMERQVGSIIAEDEECCITDTFETQPNPFPTPEFPRMKSRGGGQSASQFPDVPKRVRNPNSANTSEIGFRVDHSVEFHPSERADVRNSNGRVQTSETMHREQEKKQMELFGTGNGDRSTESRNTNKDDSEDSSSDFVESEERRANTPGSSSSGPRRPSAGLSRRKASNVNRGRGSGAGSGAQRRGDSFGGGSSSSNERESRSNKAAEKRRHESEVKRRTGIDQQSVFGEVCKIKLIVINGNPTLGAGCKITYGNPHVTGGGESHGGPADREFRIEMPESSVVRVTKRMIHKVLLKSLLKVTSDKSIGEMWIEMKPGQKPQGLSGYQMLSDSKTCIIKIFFEEHDVLYGHFLNLMDYESQCLHLIEDRSGDCGVDIKERVREYDKLLTVANKHMGQGRKSYAQSQSSEKNPQERGRECTEVLDDIDDKVIQERPKSRGAAERDDRSARGQERLGRQESSASFEVAGRAESQIQPPEAKRRRTITGYEPLASSGSGYMSRRLQEKSDKESHKEAQRERDMKSFKSTEVVVQYPLELVGMGKQKETKGKDGSVTVTGNDIATLQPREFLNDTIIDFYLKYIERELLDEKERERCHFFGIYFWKLLSQVGADNSEQAHNNVRNWTRGFDIFQKDFVFVPIGEDLHWTLAIICAPAGIKNFDNRKHQRVCTTDDGRIFTILYMDSMGGFKKNVLTLLTNYLRVEWRLKMGSSAVQPDEDTISVDSDGYESDPPAKKLYNGRNVQVPQQDNSCDCGVFVLEFIQRFIKDFTQEGCPSVSDWRDSQSKTWFKQSEIKTKRADIMELLKKLNAEYMANLQGGMAETDTQLPRTAIDAQSPRNVTDESVRSARARPYHTARDALPASVSSQAATVTCIQTPLEAKLSVVQMIRSGKGTTDVWTEKDGRRGAEEGTGGHLEEQEENEVSQEAGVRVSIEGEAGVARLDDTEDDEPEDEQQAVTSLAGSQAPTGLPPIPQSC